MCWQVPDEAGSAASAQERLEKVWQLLRMPDAARLDMAIKYSGNTWFSKLEDVSAHAARRSFTPIRRQRKTRRHFVKRFCC